MKKVTEDNLQAEIVKWYNNTYCLKHHMPRGLIFSVPNGGRRDPREAIKLKATGLLPGVSDLVVVTGSGLLLWIEVKIDLGRQSPEQIEFQKRVEVLGYRYHVVKSLEEFANVVSIG